MKVYFIGAGPGAWDLLTLRAHRILQGTPLIIMAGSLIPRAVVPKPSLRNFRRRIIDSASLTLAEIIEHIARSAERGRNVARLHSGDPALYGAIAEQMRQLDRLGIDWETIPGVPAWAAAAAACRCELTLPEICQSVVLTRTATRSSPMPEGEGLQEFARTGASLAIHLSINNLAKITRDLIPYYGEDCPAIVAWKVSWPEQKIIAATLKTIRQEVKKHKITRTALILVGKTLKNETFSNSRLYDAGHTHVFRQAK